MTLQGQIECHWSTYHPKSHQIIRELLRWFLLDSYDTSIIKYWRRAWRTERLTGGEWNGHFERPWISALMFNWGMIMFNWGTALILHTFYCSFHKWKRTINKNLTWHTRLLPTWMEICWMLNYVNLWWQLRIQVWLTMLMQLI